MGFYISHIIKDNLIDSYIDKLISITKSKQIPNFVSDNPNDFLEAENADVDVINRRIKNGFKELIATTKEPVITESWLQYYEPTEGRGHNAHNHNRWQFNEERPNMYSGGYYLSDGEPIKDHPYSGVFAFHVRGEKHFVRPKAGMLLIWPHDIVHSVEPFYGKKHRAVINFNIQV